MIRSLAIAAILLSSTSLGYAADLAALPLRGTIGDLPQAPTWDGFYVAGHGGYANGNLDLSKVGQNQLSYLLRNTDLLAQSDIGTWTLTKARDARHASFGGLTGYNIQMDDVVVGVELDYTRTQLSANSSDSIGRVPTLADGNTYDVTVNSSVAAKLTDYGTIRGRLGYVFGNLLPFVTAGAAVGRFETAATTTVFGTRSNSSATPPVLNVPFGPLSASESKRNNYKFGYTGGLGVDYLFAGGLFGRLEYQYVAFGSFGKTDLHVARAAIGVKF